MYGFYLRALIQFSEPGLELKTRIMTLLREHRLHLQQSPWHGLPELTNSNGTPCPGSCNSQAWSAATILDALHSFIHLQ